MAMHRCVCASVFAILIGLHATPAGAAANFSTEEVDRFMEPTLLPLSVIPDLLGRFVDEVGVFRYDPQTMAYEPIPFQIDERLFHTFNEGGGNEFTALIYDVLGEDDGVLDGEDELAFLFGDCGPRDPGYAAWPVGAEPLRFEISVTDSRPGSQNGTRWIYLFTGVGLETSPTSDVSWSVSPTTSITTDIFALDYTDRWLLTGYRLFPPCGAGGDLLDRFKGRTDTGVTIQSEEIWNEGSLFLGGIVGPVRAIRYVMGAASGVNTLHHDIVYRAYWTRHIRLRVHPLNWVRLYFDWLPLAEAEFYSSRALSGVDVDGIPDAVAGAFPAWDLFHSDEGGLAMVYDVPPSGLYADTVGYYRDDVNYDDAVGAGGYPDDDDSAYGNHGFTMNDLGDSTVDGISMTFRFYPLCMDEGDGDEGASFADLYQHPLQVSVLPVDLEHFELSSLSVRLDGDDVTLNWQGVHPAAVYQVFRSEFPDLAPGSWTLLGETSDTTFDDSGAGSLPAVYYDVRLIEGP